MQIDVYLRRKVSVLARLTEWGQVPMPAGSWVYHDDQCDMQPWVRDSHYSDMSTQPSILRGMVKRIAAFGLINSNKWRL